MLKRLTVLFIAFFFLLGSKDGLAAFSEQDSLLALLKKNPGQTTRRVDILIDYVQLTRHAKPYEAIKYAEEALAISQKLRYQKGESDSYYDLSAIYGDFNNYTRATDYASKCLAIDILSKDSARISSSLFNLGGIFNAKEDFPRAMKLYFQALRFLEAKKQERRRIGTLISIGGVFSKQGNNTEAMKYYEEALVLAKKYDDIDNIANVQHNMALVYEGEDKLDKALSLYFSSAKIVGDHDLYTVADAYNNIAGIYYVRQQTDSCLFYAMKARDIRLSIGDTAGYVSVNSNIASLYVMQKKFDLGIKAYETGVAYAKKTGYKLLLKSLYSDLAQVYHDLDNDTKAYAYQKLYQELNDSIFNSDNTKQIAEMQAKYDTEKKEAEIALLNKEKELSNSEISKQRIMLGALAGIILLVAGMGVTAFRAYRTKQKTNLQLAVKNKEIESQKHILEEKNKEITDSIQYASKIQNALITSSDYIDQFIPQNFIVYQPKDIVSGDFYWALNVDKKDGGRCFYLATADCTGHGVPGAFMSLLNISIFNEVLIEKKITQPDLVLNEARKDIIRALNPKGNEDTKDGMDCILCCFDFTNGSDVPMLRYAAANNSFYIIREGQLIVCGANKMPVGKSPNEQEPFTLHSVELRKNDLVYTFTDGYADQFGGEKGKKFKYKQLEALLLSVASLPLAEQSAILYQRFNDWKGNLEQVDDVLLIGIRI